MEQFAIRFKLPETASDFAKIFIDARDKELENSSSSEPPSPPTKATTAALTLPVTTVSSPSAVASDSVVKKPSPKPTGKFDGGFLFEKKEETNFIKETEEKPSSKNQQPFAFGDTQKASTFSFGSDKPKDAEPKAFSFGQSQSKPAESGFSFSFGKSNTETNASQFSFNTGNQNGGVSKPSTNGGFSFNPPKETDSPKVNGGFSFAPKESEPEKEPEEVDQNENEPYFEPIVQLAEVEVKTGEEDEEVLFCSRAKLYRFNDSQWKERGLGELKILKGKNNKSRIVMRRENIHKLCANHLIPADIKLSKLSDKENTRIWFAMDGTTEEEEPSVQQFCVRFKEDATALEFEKIILVESSSKVIEQPAIGQPEPPKITNVTTNKGILYMIQ